jgi:hypothetical protein
MLSETGSDPNVEFGLLLACSKLPADEVVVRNLASQVRDWEKFVRYAKWHELAPLVCHTLMLHSAASLPPAISEYFLTSGREMAQRNLLLTAELLRIMQALRIDNIPAIAYKGPVLAASAYGNLAMRGFCDLDILLPETDVRRALRIMPELGYRAEYNLTSAQEAKYFRTTCEYNFLHESNHTPVEIHWQIVPPKLGLTFEFSRLWSRARLLSIGNSRIPVLSPEDTLLVLSVHGFKHLWARLKWVCDMAMVLSSSDDVDWTYIMNEAERMGALRIVLVAFSLVNRMFATELSEPILAKLLRDSVAGSVVNEIVHTYESARPKSRLETGLLMFRVFSGLRNRATFMRRVLLNPSMEEAVLAPERPVTAMRTRRMLHVAREAIFDYCRSRTG